MKRVKLFGLRVKGWWTFRRKVGVLGNFTVVNPLTSPPAKDGEGHYHYYMDDATGYTAAWTPTITFRPSVNTALGPHTMYFVLATNVHEEVAPKVEAAASFTVE
jgi:hypothetical protein